jgi:ADAMTS-like protein 1/3
LRLNPVTFFCLPLRIQLRSVHCMVRVKNTTKMVDNILCEDAGLKSPDTIEKCNNVPCPQWIATTWTPCRSSKCFAWHTALQKRNVSCRFDNELKETHSDKCDENEKPTTKQECYNELCKGVWRVEQWSEVRDKYLQICGSVYASETLSSAFFQMRSKFS